MCIKIAAISAILHHQKVKSCNLLYKISRYSTSFLLKEHREETNMAAAHYVEGKHYYGTWRLRLVMLFHWMLKWRFLATPNNLLWDCHRKNLLNILGSLCTWFPGRYLVVKLSNDNWNTILYLFPNYLMLEASLGSNLYSFGLYVMINSPLWKIH